MNLVILSHSQVTRRAPNQAHPSPNFHTALTRGRLSSRQAQNVGRPRIASKCNGGPGNRVVKVLDRGWSCHEFKHSTIKDPHVGQRCTLNLSRAQTSSRWCGGVVRRGVPSQVSSTSLDHGSK
ncbi:hypothetical protein TNCV_2949511 [Trichonephila clavipes]|nr:hypothetical protein TNCV_2949511 [Trichonephila clavipes]